jgi:hypothetical protein
LAPQDTVFIVGRRTRKMVYRVLGEDFNNWLMTDDHHVDGDPRPTLALPGPGSALGELRTPSNAPNATQSD